MKRPAKQLDTQMNLPLLNAPATAVPNHKQKELALTLMELLINAARANNLVLPANGGEMNHPKLTADRLLRKAIVYVRQSSPHQMLHHQESQRRQYGLVDRARELGFQQVTVIDEDLGRTGSGFVERPGFHRLAS